MFQEGDAAFLERRLSEWRRRPGAVHERFRLVLGADVDAAAPILAQSKSLGATSK
jgi:hypothetical protein